MFSDDFIEQMRAYLVARRASKIKILEAGGEQARSHSPKDIVRIDFALRRIREGQYGLCTQCGGPIAEERLRIIPEAPMCTGCAETISKQQSKSRTH